MKDTVSTSDGRTYSLRPYNGLDDGILIRDLTEKNFKKYLERTIGWDAENHKRQPEFPDRYTMVEDDTGTIGFFSIRDEPEILYLETIQIKQTYRNKGIGTQLMKHLEGVANNKKKNKIRFRVFKDNPARHLYEHLGYKIIEDQDWCFLMGKEMTG